ncbi:MAG: 16S rRNA (cytosine(1402)-N(4))-methyltransferase RsmH [Acidimicrobiia bacterium]
MHQKPHHLSVMTSEVVDLLAPIESGLVLDATFGAGGHTRALVESIPGVQILALDRDPSVTCQVPRTRLVIANFAELESVLDQEGVDELAGAVFDLGLSSDQLDDADRGFSYHASGPLDMRMGPDALSTASDLVNTASESDLRGIISRFGEERFARRIARAIVAARPIEDTTRLAEVVADAVPAPARRRGHPARRSFQAIRIAANDELGALEAGLDVAIRRLRVGGRIVVISYHSLEDRLVKKRFTAGAIGCVCPPELPVCGCGTVAELRLLTRSSVGATDAEIEINRRARSARLRAAERADPLDAA